MELTKMNKKIKLQIYPSTIEVGRYYWLRRLQNYSITLVKVVVDLKNDELVVEIDEQYKKTVSKREILIFDPNSKLFKTLMRLPMYRTDPQIKKVLIKMNLKPELFQVAEVEVLDTFDCDISAEEFYREYDKFMRDDVQYWDISLNYSKKFVTGANKLDLYELYVKVCLNGGMERITNEQRWKSLFYAMMSKTNVSYTMRTFYKKHLYEFEFLRRQKEDEFDYCYKFETNQNVFLNANQSIYYGTVKLRRNRGLNQYYLQFIGWSKEYCEWYCEDVLILYDKKLTHDNIMKRRTRSSKANNLIDDPLTREKHCHLGARMIKNDITKSKNDVAIEFQDQSQIDDVQENKKSNEKSVKEKKYGYRNLMDDECIIKQDSFDNKHGSEYDKKNGMHDNIIYTTTHVKSDKKFNFQNVEYNSENDEKFDSENSEQNTNHNSFVTELEIPKARNNDLSVRKNDQGYYTNHENSKKLSISNKLYNTKQNQNKDKSKSEKDVNVNIENLSNHKNFDKKSDITYSKIPGNLFKTLIDSKKRKKSVTVKDMFKNNEIQKISKKDGKKNGALQKQSIKKTLIDKKVINEDLDITEWNEFFLRFFNL